MKPKLDHIAVAVPDLGDVLATWRDLIGLAEQGRDTVEGQGASVAFLDAGGARVELVSPTSDDTPIGRYLALRGPGLHHVALRVEDIAVALEHLRGHGVRLVDEAPRPGAHGTRVAFVHPKATGGVLLELVEYPEE